MRELETERLRLRKLRRGDTQRIFDVGASGPEVTKYVTWCPHESVAVTEQVMAYWLADYEKPDCYRYGIELKETGELIGMIDVNKTLDGEPVLGYCSGRPAWGHGYMTEALKAMCAMLFDEGCQTLLIEAVRENIGSNRVIRKAGFRPVKTYERPLSDSKPEIVTINSYRLDKE